MQLSYAGHRGHSPIAQLKSDVIRKRWQTIELEKAVDKIHNKQQD